MEKILATAVIKMLTKGIGVATAEAQEQRAYTVEGESERCQQQEKKVRLGIQWGWTQTAQRIQCRTNNCLCKIKWLLCIESARE